MRKLDPLYVCIETTDSTPPRDYTKLSIRSREDPFMQKLSV